MQRVINYGSFLQAYALKQLLLKNGADEVGFIDIVPGRQLRGFETSGLRYKLRRLKSLLKVVIAGRAFEKRRTLDFMAKVRNVITSSWPLLGLSDSNEEKRKFDLAVIGSDEVFHCCQATPWGFTGQLYGDIPQAGKVVSYAASFGGTKSAQLVELGIAEEIGNRLKTLREISVRDENSKLIVERLTGITPRLNIDPVLAYGFNNEIENSADVNERNYILIYSYPDRINDLREIKAIVRFAAERKKKLISVMSRYDWCDEAIIPNPLELLGWFKNADYVITETFHGTIFSIITHRQFATIGRESAMPKLTSMLEPYGLLNRLVTKNNDLDQIFSSTIDYAAVDMKLAALRKNTNDYLNLILNL